jgi:ribosomal protein S18 acetylase RimI-like enzyme
MHRLSFTFRRARAEDIEELYSLINSAYRGDSARRGWTHEADLVGGLRTTPDELKEIIARPNEFFLLAYSQEKLLGSMHYRDEGEGVYFGMLAVRPELQNRTVGTRLMAEGERIAIEDGKKFIRFVVIHVRKELIAYYESKGFQLTGKSEPFPVQYPAMMPGLLLVEMKKTL